MTRKEEVTKAADRYWKDVHYVSDLSWTTIVAFKKGAEWADSTAWKPADGDNLPEIDREVIALVEEYNAYKVVFAHRPPEHWDGKNLITGKVTTHTPKRYGKGKWNQPNVKWWLDLELPEMEE